jgi:hypothetical protein
MPSVSKKQHNLMAAVAHSAAFAKKVGIPQSVGKEFATADKGRKFGKGGNVGMEKKVAKYFAKKGEKALAAHEEREAAGKEEDTKAIAKKEERVLKGAPKAMKEYESKEHKEMGFKRGGGMGAAMSASGMGGGMGGMGGMRMRRPKAAPPVGGPTPMSGMGMKKGGGIERKGKTDGKKVKMARGGGIESKGKTRGRMC